MRKTILLLVVVLLSLQFRFCKEEDSRKSSMLLQLNAQYPEGNDAFEAYIKKKLERPKELEDNPINGYLMQFIVEIDGTLSNIESIENPKPFGYENAIKIIKENKTLWIPAKSNGKPIRTTRTVFAYFNENPVCLGPPPIKSNILDYESKDPQYIFVFVSNDAQYPGAFKHFRNMLKKTQNIPKKLQMQKYKEKQMWNSL
jgi:hypothetical protein